MKNIVVDGVEYVPVTEKASNLDGLEYVLVRTFSAGVFAGYLQTRKGKEGTLKKARRIHCWDGAASLSQLAMEGVTKPENCRFAMEVDSIDLTEIIEVIPITKKAQDNINAVPVWKK